MFTIDFNRLDIRPGSKIIDIGCGEGRHTIKAAQQNNVFSIGADYGYATLTKAKKKIAFHRYFNDLSCRSVDLSCMDATKLPLPDNSFDVVICSEVLEHIPEDKRAIEELIRIVKPGKILAVSVPRFWTEKICWLLSDHYFDANMGHVRIYKKNELIHAIESFGVTCFASHYAHSFHSPYWWLKCLVGPTRTDETLVNLYHRFLMWDLINPSNFTSLLDRVLSPFLGKSLVLYFRKDFD